RLFSARRADGHRMEQPLKLSDEYDSPELDTDLGHERPVPKACGRGNFSRLPAAAVFDRNVTNGNLRVLAALGKYANKDGMCYPSVRTIAQALGVTRQAVQNHMRRLKIAGYLEVQRQRRTTGGFGPNLYRLKYPAEPRPSKVIAR